MPISLHGVCACACLAFLALAQPALAQEPAPAPAATTAVVPLDLSRLHSAFTLTDDQAAMLRAGIAKTAVDHRFADRLTGSLGFLCGLHGETYQGAAAMRGSDPDGRFLGAKLSLAFR